MRESLKHILRGTLFCLLGAAIILGLNQLALKRMLDQPQAGYIQPIDQYRELVRPRIRANVVIIGTSHTAHGVDPRFLEYGGNRVFNFSLSGAGTTYYHDWYVHLFRPYYPKPDLMIVGVDWFLFNNKYLDRKLTDDSVYLPWKLIADKMLDRSFPVPPEELLKNKLSLMGGKQHLLDVLFSSIPGSNPAAVYYRGYIPMNLDYEGCGGVIRDIDEVSNIEPEAVKRFEMLLDALQQDGIRVLFLQTPELIPCRITDDDTMELTTRIAKERGITFLDYNAELASKMNFNVRLYSTWGHLNQEGSQVFSARLARDLVKLMPNGLGRSARRDGGNDLPAQTLSR